MVRILLTIFFLRSLLAFSAEESYSLLESSPASSTTYSVLDGKWSYMQTVPTWNNEFHNKAVVNWLELGVDRTHAEILGSYWIEVEIEVTPYTLMNASQSSVTVTLELSYDGSTQGVQERIRSVYTMPVGYHKYTMEILSVTDKNTSTPTSLPANVYLEGHIDVERYYSFSHTAVPSSFNHQALDHSNSGSGGYQDDVLLVYWNHISGAESYELEWTYVNDYSPTSASTPALKSSIYFTKLNFRFNATRIRTSSEHYEIPLIYDRGYIVYRIRAIGRRSEDGYTQDVYGHWSTDGLTYSNIQELETALNGFGSGGRGIYQSTGHQPDKNWQFVASYAEDGKRKDVVSYFDGSLRNRQSVTQISSTGTTIVGETVYDSQGRPSVNILPVPSDSAQITYHNRFNQDVNGNVYSRANFDYDNSNCDVSTDALGSTTGAGAYYSQHNSLSNDHQDYVPDAGGYPYTYTQYTPDNTGRISLQTGVGQTHNKGSGHETIYMYGQADQEELDRLFGSNVGYKSRYKKNIVIDANGQASVTYIDPYGRTIATGLIGESPDNLSSLQEVQINGDSSRSYTGSALSANALGVISVDLLNKVLPTDADSVYDDNLLKLSGNIPGVSANDMLYMSSQRLNPLSNAAYSYNYTLTSNGSFTDSCMSEQYEYIFDVKLSLKDQCGIELFDETSTPGGELFSGQWVTLNSGYTGALDSLDGTPLSINDDYVFNPGLAKGEYTLSKTLRVNPDALEYYAERYYEDISSCENVLTLEDFQDQWSTIIDTLDCQFTCSDCLSDLQATYGDINNIGDVDGDGDIDQDDTDLWHQMYQDCIEPCQEKSTCEVSYDMMLQDVSPGGQYGSLDNTSPDWDVSVFNLLNKLGANYTDWNDASIIYHDADGNVSLIQVINGEPAYSGNTTPIDGKEYVTPNQLSNLSDLEIYWQDSWSEDLVISHPEYCYYTQWCSPLESQVNGVALTDNQYNTLLNYIDNYSEANTTIDLDTYPFLIGSGNTNTINSLSSVSDLVNNDPYFYVGNLGSTQKTSFESDLNGYATVNISSGSTLVDVFDYVAYLYGCGSWYGQDGCTNYNDFQSLMSSSISQSDKNQLWQEVIALYQSLKQQYMANKMQESAITSDCYNGCIGNPVFDIHAHNFFVPGAGYSAVNHYFDTHNQPCAYNRRKYFAGKQSRFMVPGSSHASVSSVEDAQALAHKGLYEETGRCPMSFDLEAFLNDLLVDDKIIGSISSLLPYKSFTSAMYESVSGLDMFNNNYAASNYSSINTTTLLTGTITSNSNTENFTLDLTGSGLSWSNYGATNDWVIVGFSQLTYLSGVYNFEILVQVKDNNTGDIEELIFTGTTGFGIGQCAANIYADAGTGSIIDDCLPNEMANTLLMWFIDWQQASFSAPYNIPLEISDNTALGDLIQTTSAHVSADVTGSVYTFDGSIGTLTLTASLALNASDQIIGIKPGMNAGSFNLVVDQSGTIIEIPFISSFTQGGNTQLIHYGDCSQTPDCQEQTVFLEGYADMLYTLLTSINASVSNGSPSITATASPVVKEISTISHLKVEESDGSSTMDYNLYENDTKHLCEGNQSINLGIGYQFSDIVSVESVEVINQGDVLSGSNYQVLITVLFNDDTYQTFTNTICIPGLCPRCIPELESIKTCDAQWTAYDALTLPGEPVLSKDDFCDQGLYYGSDQYITYIQQATLNIVDETSDYYVSLENFNFYNLKHYYQDYIDFITLIGFPSSYAAEYISLIDYALASPSNLCEISYKDYLNNLALDADTLNVIEYCQQASIDPDYRCFPQDPFIMPTDTVENPCVSYLKHLTAFNAESEWEAYKDSIKDDFKRRYIDSAIAQVVETFSEQRPDQEYHHTLYFYDQSGSLVRTVPPMGVQMITSPLDLQTVKQERKENVSYASKTIHPGHTLSTTYTYNTLNQLKRQYTPDGRKSEFWYDHLSRLILSQDSDQAGKSEYSYTFYDALGRVVEVGQMESPATVLTTNDLASQMAFEAWINSGTLREVTKTFYDGEQFVTPISAEPNELRNRIAHVTYVENYNPLDPNQYDYATHYAYDIHGNVKTMLQDVVHLANLDQRYKRIDYDYDLISGNVNQVVYQDGDLDEFHHRYQYDADNRITHTQTSSKGLVWEEDAQYFYYDHGPLARVETGDNKVQGSDFMYTIHGWLKGVNSNTLKSDRDAGKDGDYLSGGIHAHVAQDVMGFSLGYFSGDYKSVSDDYKLAITGSNDYNFLANIQNNSTLSGNNLYNGNIGHMFTAIAPLTSGGQDPQIMVYDYDQLNRITASAKLGALVDASNNVGSAGLSDAYRTAYKYDYNGNITELERYDDQGTLMDDLIYHYKNDHQGSAINQLKHVTEQVVGSSQSEDLEPMSQGNYSYNAIGQLIGDASEEIGEIIWNNAAKVRHIKRTTGSTKPDLEFVYGPMGNRIIKIVKPKDAGGNLEGQDQWTYTYYLRDAQGNVMATYERSWNVVSAGLQSEEYYTLNEHHLYGSDRLGLQKYDQQLSQTIVDYTGFTSDGYFNNPDYDPLNITLTTSSEIHHIDQGDKYYECKNHLGNVLVVISDRNLPVDAGTDGYWEYFQADIVSYSDYYPFGSLQPRRHHQSPEYRYGFQGQEKDDEVKGTGNSVNYKYRMHDPRLGRFFAVDPLTAKYPWYSPYQFSGNKVIQFVELEGLEEGFSTMHMQRNWERQDRLYDEGKITWEEYNDMRTRSQVAAGLGGLAGTAGVLLWEAAAVSAPVIEVFTYRAAAYAVEYAMVAMEGVSFVANLLYDGPDDPFPTPGPGGEMGKAINKTIKPVARYVSNSVGKRLNILTESIRFSQSSVNNYGKAVESLKNGTADPIDIVKMKDNMYTTVDNTRLLAAKKEGLDVKVNTHNYDDALPESMLERFENPNQPGQYAKTWGEAVEFRANSQNAAFRENYGDTGTFVDPKVNS